MSLADSDLAKKGKAKARERFTPAVEAALEPGEQLRVWLPVSQGLGFWWMFVLTPLLALFWKQYVVALTDRRLIFLDVSRGGRPQGMAFAIPPSEASVIGFSAGVFPKPMGRLRIAHAQDARGLNYAWPWLPEAEALRQALSFAAPSTAAATAD